MANDKEKRPLTLGLKLGVPWALGGALLGFNAGQNFPNTPTNFTVTCAPLEKVVIEKVITPRLEVPVKVINKLEK